MQDEGTVKLQCNFQVSKRVKTSRKERAQDDWFPEGSPDQQLACGSVSVHSHAQHVRYRHFGPSLALPLPPYPWVWSALYWEVVLLVPELHGLGLEIQYLPRDFFTFFFHTRCWCCHTWCVTHGKRRHIANFSFISSVEMSALYWVYSGAGNCGKLAVWLYFKVNTQNIINW